MPHAPDSPKRSLLVVCSGNVCRSPMAEYLLRARLEPTSEWEVHSAGLYAVDGLPASAMAVAALRERGVDLTSHRSRALTSTAVRSASVILVMTTVQRETLTRLYPEVRERVFLLRSFDPSAEARDIEDPIGGSLADYRKVRDQIERALPDVITFLSRLDGDPR